MLNHDFVHRVWNGTVGWIIRGGPERHKTELSRRVHIESLERRRFLSGSPLSSLPVLDSLPGAAVKLFLDFNGDPARTWAGYSVPTTPAFDLDGDATTFSSGELGAIQQVWARVAELYSPFNLNVTTVDPGNRNHLETAQVVIGGSGSWYGGGVGGTSKILGFLIPSLPNTAYIFPASLANDSKLIALGAAHEAGHMFGLNHQSVWSGTTKTQEYNPGTTDAAPLMGIAYSSTRALWWNGTSSVSYAVMQDDMATISDLDLNGFGYRVDDYGNTSGTATVLSGSTPSASGIISETTDTDWFQFTTTGGTVSFTAAVAQYGAMLDLKLELYNSSGLLITSSDTSSLGETLATSVAAGTYYIVVGSHGSYGDVGQYALSGVAPLDTVGPSVPTGSFQYRNGPPGTPMNVQFSFAENVTGSMALDLINLDTSTAIESQGLYNPVTQTVIFTFYGFSSGVLPKGNYRATILASNVADSNGNSMVGDAVFSFGFLPGDANDDRMVDVRDLYLMSVNWWSTGATCAQGDFNFDGTVDDRDLGVLALNWQQSLAPAPSPAMVSARSTSSHARVAIRQPIRTLLQ